MNQDLEKQRLWRWALRGIVIQWKSGNIGTLEHWLNECLLFGLFTNTFLFLIWKNEKMKKWKNDSKWSTYYTIHSIVTYLGHLLLTFHIFRRAWGSRQCQTESVPSAPGWRWTCGAACRGSGCLPAVSVVPGLGQFWRAASGMTGAPAFSSCTRVWGCSGWFPCSARASTSSGRALRRCWHAEAAAVWAPLRTPRAAGPASGRASLQLRWWGLGSLDSRKSLLSSSGACRGGRWFGLNSLMMMMMMMMTCSCSLFVVRWTLTGFKCFLKSIQFFLGILHLGGHILCGSVQTFFSRTLNPKP